MPVECPNCRRPIARARIFFTAAWGRWRCEGCGALLGVDVRRRLLATIPWLAILVFLIGVVRITNLGYVIAVPVLIGAGVLNYVLFDRAVVHERTGFLCRQCGYDLCGQVEPRCPECGTVFDLAERDAALSDAPVSQRAIAWYRSRVAITIMIIGLTLMVVLGAIYFRTVQIRAAGTGVPATRPTTQTASQTSPDTQAAADPG